MKATYLLQQKQLIKILELGQAQAIIHPKKTLFNFKTKKSYNQINYTNIENFNL